MLLPNAQWQIRLDEHVRTQLAIEQLGRLDLAVLSAQMLDPQSFASMLHCCGQNLTTLAMQPKKSMRKCMARYDKVRICLTLHRAICFSHP